MGKRSGGGTKGRKNRRKGAAKSSSGQTDSEMKFQLEKIGLALKEMPGDG